MPHISYTIPIVSDWKVIFKMNSGFHVRTCLYQREHGVVCCILGKLRVCCLSSMASVGTTVIWKTGGTSDWSDPTNWSPRYFMRLSSVCLQYKLLSSRILAIQTSVIRLLANQTSFWLESHKRSTGVEELWSPQKCAGSKCKSSHTEYSDWKHVGSDSECFGTVGH